MSLLARRRDSDVVVGIRRPPAVGTLATATGMQVAFAAGSALALGAAGLAAVGLTEPDDASPGRAGPVGDVEPATD